MKQQAFQHSLSDGATLFDDSVGSSLRHCLSHEWQLRVDCHLRVSLESEAGLFHHAGCVQVGFLHNFTVRTIARWSDCLGYSRAFSYRHPEFSYSPSRWSIEYIPLPRRANARAARSNVMSISYPPTYFFFNLLIENHVVDSIHNAESTATMGVSIPRINASPPKNSTTPPNGTIAAGIPMLFIQAPPWVL